MVVISSCASFIEWFKCEKLWYRCAAWLSSSIRQLVHMLELGADAVTSRQVDGACQVAGMRLSERLGSDL